MAPGGVLQRDAREIYDRIDAAGEAAADLLVNAEDNAMTGRIDKPCPQNIANAARQYKIVVPFAASQQPVRKTLGELFPASIEQWRIRVQGGVVPDIVGLESSAKARKVRIINVSRALVENDQCRARDARSIRQRRERFGPRLGRDRGIEKRCNKRGHGKPGPKSSWRNLTNLAPFKKSGVDGGQAIFRS